MHTIRLRKPWQRIDPDTSVHRVDVPDLEDGLADEVSDAATLGAFTYARKFNLPSGLDDQTRVHLSVQTWRGDRLEIWINDVEVLSTQQPNEIDIDVTDSLQRHNEVSVRVFSSDGIPGRLTGEVELRIYPAASAMG